MNHSDLNAGSLPAILDFFNLDPPANEMRGMLAEFSWNSKQSLQRSLYAPPDLHAAPRLIPAEIRKLYSRLLAM